jgi:biopolymer transport protein ExbD
MRRFSQRNSLVTLSEINITPLLDLAFVLLIIFVITTPLLEKGFKLNLPKVDGASDQRVDRENVRTVEIDARGNFMLNRRAMPAAQIEQELKTVYNTNKNLVVFIRADKDGKVDQFADIINRCVRNDITKFSFRTVPEK